MLIAISVLLCLASVPLLGGRLAALAQLRWRAAGALAAALAAQLLAAGLAAVAARAASRGAHLASYGAGAWFVWANRGLPGMLVLGAGGALNGVAIASNGGVMPASARALRAAGLDAGAERLHSSAALAAPRLALLGDQIALPLPGGLANVASIGDVLILVGVLVLAHASGRSRAARWAGAAARGVRERLAGVRRGRRADTMGE